MSTRVHSLSQEELQLVLANVPFAERLSHAPCVCKAWRKALAAPSMAWEHCHIRSCELAACIGDTDDSQIRMQKNRILRWAVRRGAAVRCLQVNFKPTEDLESLLQALLPSMSGLLQLGLTGRIGGSLWTLAALTQLRRLTIDVHEPYMNTISQHLQPLTTLTSLDLSRLGSGPLRDNVQGFRALCSLTLLERLWLSRFGLLGRLPGLVSRLTGLVHLHLEECGVQGLPAEISTLRSLRKLALVSNPLEEDTALPASMVECTGLQYLDLSCNDLDRLPQNLHLLTSLCGLEIDYHTMLLADCGLGSLVNLRLLLLDWDVVIEQSLTALGQLQLLVLRAINMSPGDMLQPCTMANLLGLAQCRAALGQLKLGLMIYPGDTTQFPVQFVEQLLLLNNKPGIEITYASPDWRRTMPCAWTNQFEKELERLTLATQ